jgi:TldD protein
VLCVKDGKDLAEYCVEYGHKLGGSYVEARYVKDTTRALAFRNGEPFSGGYSPSTGIGVRILVDGNMGFASFDRLDKELAEETISIAYKMAKNTRRKEPIDLGESVSNQKKWKMKAKEPLRDIEMDTLMAISTEINIQMEGLAAYSFLISPKVIDKVLVTNEGTQIESQL